MVSFADLYGGKLVAALDSQHPRDCLATVLGKAPTRLETTEVNTAANAAIRT
jgi:hypothetical protein